MTNREFITMLLKSESSIDDGGASYEAMVYYNVACPYTEGDDRAHCKDTDDMTRDMCVGCKMEWLDAEVDT